MAKGLTQHAMFVLIAEFLEGAEAPGEYVDFINSRIEQLDKRAKAPKAPTKTQIANVELKGDIVTVLTSDGVDDLTATEIAKAIGVNVQKASALLRQMVLDGVVTRLEDKGKAYFRA